MLKVHILTDDRVRGRGLIAEHGLSLWIQKDDKYILFDTGQSSVYLQNAGNMGIDPELADYIVISHGHYDHGGGLGHFPYRGKKPPIYAHPDVFLRKLAAIDRDEPSREVGIPFEISEKGFIRNRVVYTKEPVEIDKGIMVSGEIPRSSSFEDTPDDFFIEKGGKTVPDILLDEQMLIMEDNGEIAVFLGCSHPGVVNSLMFAMELFPQWNIKLLVAGMHLDKVEPVRLGKTIDHILDAGIKNVVPLHCTGFEAMCEIKRRVGKNCILMCTGDSIVV